MEVTALKSGVAPGLRGASPLLRLQPDERLIALTRRGQHAAFETLFSRYHSRLLSFCRHMLGSREDAEDVLQEVFAAAFNAVLADERPINVRPWLYRIARNRSLNHLRRASAIGVDSMDVHFAEHGLSTGDQVLRRESFRELIGDVQQLPETQRTALLLREIDALSYEQIALAMDTTVPSVKSLLVRARISLAEAAEARKLTCEEVRGELGEVAEGLVKVSPPVRRHLRDCERCRTFRKLLKQNNHALAAVLPVGPLLLLKRLVLQQARHLRRRGTRRGRRVRRCGGRRCGRSGRWRKRSRRGRAVHRGRGRRCRRRGEHRRGLRNRRRRGDRHEGRRHPCRSRARHRRRRRGRSHRPRPPPRHRRRRLGCRGCYRRPHVRATADRALDAPAVHHGRGRRPRTARCPPRAPPAGRAKRRSRPTPRPSAPTCRPSPSCPPSRHPRPSHLWRRPPVGVEVTTETTQLPSSTTPTTPAVETPPPTTTGTTGTTPSPPPVESTPTTTSPAEEPAPVSAPGSPAPTGEGATGEGEGDHGSPEVTGSEADLSEDGGTPAPAGP